MRQFSQAAWLLWSVYKKAQNAGISGRLYRGGESSSRFPQRGLFHHRIRAGLTGTNRDSPCPITKLIARSRRTTPKKAQMVIDPSTIEIGSATRTAMSPKTPAMNRDLVAKYIPHAVHRAGRLLEAKNLLPKGMVFCRQFGHS